MKIEIWSDVVCPWCYIGKRRLERAVAAFPHPVEIVYRSFELDPSAPADGGERTVESLARRFGGRERVAQMQQQVRQLGLAEGLDLRLDETWHVSTVDAHRLLHLALDTGGTEQQGRLKEALLRAHFEEVRNLSDHAVLQEVAVSSGLDPDAVAETLAGSRFREAVRADIDQARSYGAGGVPFFVFEEAYAVSGAQPTETFAQVMDQVWQATRPALVPLSGADAEVCGPEGCD